MRIFEVDSNGDDQIVASSKAQLLPLRTICDVLRELIDTALSKATSKVWHGSPVWFINDNPVVGYNATAKTVNLLFCGRRKRDRSTCPLFDRPCPSSSRKRRARVPVLRKTLARPKPSGFSRVCFN